MNRQLFEQLITSKMQGLVPVQTHWAEALEVDWQQKTMKAVAVKNKVPFYGVSLGLGGLYRKPKPGSLCLIGIVENQAGDSFLIDAEKVEEFAYKSGDSAFTIKEKGFIVKQGGESLKEVLNDWQQQFGKLCDELAKVVVSIGVSPNVPAITKIKAEVKEKIQKRLNQILIE